MIEAGECCGDLLRASEFLRASPQVVIVSLFRTYFAVGLTFADHRDFRPRMPTGSASPTRWRDMAFPRSRLASMRAAASAYGTIIWGISDAKTGSNNGRGRARANAGT